MRSVTVLTHPSTDKVKIKLEIEGEYKEWIDLYNSWMHFFECFNWRQDD